MWFAKNRKVLSAYSNVAVKFWILCLWFLLKWEVRKYVMVSKAFDGTDFAFAKSVKGFVR